MVKLADRFQERQRLDIPGGSADFGNGNIGIRGIQGRDRPFDFIGDVGNNLNRPAKITAFAFAVDDIAVNAPGGVVTCLGTAYPGETFVMAEIKVGFGAVIGYVNLSRADTETWSRDRR